ncbi:hypothetical protein [Pedobacter frigoris]|uniref:hypothetical protein n=1 Tax=Pedobacter frigoris TaxID=2571272 RepID=UPI00292DD4B9|nr:hypothetical protein [Pedobacter frigoris]
MRPLQILIFTILLSVPVTLMAQVKIIAVGEVSDDNWMPINDANVLKSMKLNYKKPAIFSEVIGMECFNENARLNQILNCANHQLHADDSQFIAFIRIEKPFSKADSIDLKKFMPGGNFDHIDKQHTNYIRGDIRNSMGKDASLNWKQYVTYYSAKEAKTKFNADSAVFVPIKLDSQDYYKGKYNNLEALYLQKKGRGFVNFYCFYTDKAKKNLSEYRKAIEGIFRYED